MFSRGCRAAPACDLCGICFHLKTIRCELADDDGVAMSDFSEQSDKESLGEKDDDFNIADYQDDVESDESFNDTINGHNAAANVSV